MCSLYHYFCKKRGYSCYIDLPFKDALMGGKFESGYHDSLWYLKGVTYIGRYERFQEDFDHVCEQVGIGKTQLPWLNASQHGHYSQYYDAEMVEYVRTHHRPTIEHFGYEFEDTHSLPGRRAVQT